MQRIGKTGISEIQQTQLPTAAPVSPGGTQGGYLHQGVDITESSTAPQFGEIYKQIQTKYGEKPEKAREIKKTLGKDDFLRIMVTQMKNQDPTNPFKAEQMASEIAQFTSVEQLQNVNQNLSKISSQNRPMEQMVMTNLIGKYVTIDKERFPHIEGQSEVLNFKLPRDASVVQVSIVGENGEIVLEKAIGEQKSGDNSFSWDGLKSNSIPAKSGNFMFRIQAKDSRGKTIETNPQIQARVIGVSFEGGEPVFLVGDSKHQDKVTLRNLVRIELEANQKLSNLNEFKRGAGSGAELLIGKEEGR